DSGAIRWERILSRVDRPLAPGEGLYGIQSPALDIRVTSLHNMVFGSRALPSWRLLPAEDPANYREFVLPVSGIEDAPGAALSDADLDFLGWFLSNGSLNRTNNAVSITQAESSPYCADIE